MFKKYKNKILWVVVAFTSIFVLFATAVLPAAAASDGWSNAVFSKYEPELYLVTQDQYNEYDPQYDSKSIQWIMPDWWTGNVEFFVSAQMSVSLSAGDRLLINEKLISGWFGGTNSSIIAVRYILCNWTNKENGKFEVANYGTYTTYNFTGGSSYNLNVKAEEFWINKDYDNAFIGIQFKVFRQADEGERVFSINYANFHYGYGNPNSPEYPKYTPFNDDTLTELENAENQVLDGTQGGLDAFKNSMNGMYGLLPNYLKPLTAVVSMINIYLGIRSLGDLISISLVFGIMAFLLSGSLVAYASRAVRSDNAKHGKVGK